MVESVTLTAKLNAVSENVSFLRWVCVKNEITVMHKFCPRETRFAGTCNVSFSYELRARKLLTCGAFGGLYGGTAVKWSVRWISIRTGVVLSGLHGLCIVFCFFLRKETITTQYLSFAQKSWNCYRITQTWCARCPLIFNLEIVFLFAG